MMILVIELAILATVVVGVSGVSLRALSTNFGVVVLQEWIEPVGANGERVRVRGRRAGLVAWLLTMMHLDPSFLLIVRDQEIEINVSSMSGRTFHRVPFHQIASTHTGLSRPIWLILLGGLMLSASAVALVIDPVTWLTSGAVWAVAGLLAVAFYLVARGVFLAIETTGGRMLLIRLTGSVIHARVIPADAARRLARLIGDLATASTDREPALAAAATHPPSREADPVVLGFCGFCGSRGPVGSPCASCGEVVS